MVIPPFLNPGDKVAITCLAGKVDLAHIHYGIELLESWRLQVVLGSTPGKAWHQFGGTDEERVQDFQRFLDDDSIKAIFSARGGYGTLRIIDSIDFSRFKANPKWLIGFSDITVLHCHVLTNYNIATIHGLMPKTMSEATEEAKMTLQKALFGEPYSITYSSTYQHNRPGKAAGKLIGGNLAFLHAVNGSVSDPDYTNTILLIEDVGEYLYNIDRMMLTLKRAGKLKNLSALLVGGFTDLKDNATPFGFTAEEIIWNYVKEYDYPVAFNFPSGHLDDNRTLLLGKDCYLEMTNTTITLS